MPDTPAPHRRTPNASPRDGRRVLVAVVLLCCTAADVGLTLLLDDALIATAIVGCLVAILLSLLAPALTSVPARG